MVGGSSLTYRVYDRRVLEQLILWVKEHAERHTRGARQRASLTLPSTFSILPAPPAIYLR